MTAGAADDDSSGVAELPLDGAPSVRSPVIALNPNRNTRTLTPGTGLPRTSRTTPVITLPRAIVTARLVSVVDPAESVDQNAPVPAVSEPIVPRGVARIFTADNRVYRGLLLWIDAGHGFRATSAVSLGPT